MIFQDPLSSLHPFYKVGSQLSEAVLTHRKRREGRGAGAVGRAARAGRDPRSPEARRSVSARVLRRHAPARDDRDGAGQRAQAADRRRAHHRARRHGAGADPRAAERSPAPARDGDHRDHPRPRRGRGDHRPHRGDVRRPDRRARPHRGDLRLSPAPLHVGAAALDPPPGHAARRGARADLRPSAEPDPPAVRLPFPPPLSLRARGSQADRSEARAGHRRPGPLRRVPARDRRSGAGSGARWRPARIRPRCAIWWSRTSSRSGRTPRTG